MRRKKFLCLGAILAVCLGLLSGCGKSKDSGSVYYLNFKPEVADIWQKIAETYTEETGVEVKILTAAGGQR